MSADSITHFLRFSAICCFLSVATTLGIHLFFPPVSGAFEQTVQLYRNDVYILNRWWVVFHCLLVVMGAWGIVWIQNRKGVPWATPALLFISFFALFEIMRQFFVLFYLNGMREAFVNSGYPAIQEQLRFAIQRFGFMSLSLFGLFILFFGLANILLGISLWREKKLGHALSIVLLAWGLINLLVLGNVFWENAAIDGFIAFFSYTFQPLARLLMGIWLWRQALHASNL